MCKRGPFLAACASGDGYSDSPVQDYRNAPSPPLPDASSTSAFSADIDAVGDPRPASQSKDSPRSGRKPISKRKQQRTSSLDPKDPPASDNQTQSSQVMPINMVNDADNLQSPPSRPAFSATRMPTNPSSSDAPGSTLASVASITRASPRRDTYIANPQAPPPPSRRPPAPPVKLNPPMYRQVR